MARPALPRIVFGTLDIHRLHGRWRLPGRSRAMQLLDCVHESGCEALDTARVYGAGAAERIVGTWLRSRGLRDRILVIGKGGHPAPGGACRLHPRALTEDLHQSLRNLAVERIDLYMLHRDDPDIDVATVMETLHEFVQAGKVAAIGASNWSHVRIGEANACAASRGLTTFSASSPHFSLAEMIRAPWTGCLSLTGVDNAAARAWYAQSGMPVLAWSPLAGGFLLQSAVADAAATGSYDSEANFRRRARLHELAARRGASPAQLALAYLLRQEVNVVPVVATTTPERVRELLSAPHVPLSDQERDWLLG